jgi:hypothetical protein
MNRLKDQIAALEAIVQKQDNEIKAIRAEAVAELESENKRLREALTFPKHENNCGGWTIDFDFLSLFANAIHEKHDDFTASLEDIETILLAIEARAALGKE